jgi:dethiobiotin synthetase
MQSLFVTATGTDIGKTWLCCRLLERLCTSMPVRCIKPIVTGFDAANPESSDTAQLLAAQQQALNADTLAATSPWRFGAALSADMAARREQRSIAFAELSSSRPRRQAPAST